MKDLNYAKYLSQLVPAATLMLCAAFGLQQSAPALEAIDWQTAQQLADQTEQVQQLSDPDGTAGVGDYEDGTYRGTGTGFRGDVTVEVLVEQRQIASVEVVEHSDDESFFDKAKALIDDIIQKQTWEVDSISGATYSSRGIKEAVENALTGKESTSEPEEKTEESAANTSSGTWKDGTYYGTGKGYGGTIKVKVVISGGKMTSIDVIEASSETASYLSKAKGIIPKMISSQSADVDAASGATLSSNGIKSAVADALNQAAGGSAANVSGSSSTGSSGSNGNAGNSGGSTQKNPYTKPANGWKDGSYSGSAKGYGGTVTAQVTIKSGKMTSISASGPNETPSYFSKAKGVIPKIISAQNPRVDAVSGATYSSNGIINAVIAALKKAENSSNNSTTNTRQEQTITTGQDSYSVKVGDKPFSLKAKAKTALSYRSNKTSVVTVDAKGTVTIVGEGTAKITVTAKKSSKYKAATKSVEITVSSASSVTKIGKATCMPDTSKQFTAYDISLGVTFDNDKPVAIAEPSSSTDATNQTYLSTAFRGMKAKLLKAQSIDAVDKVDTVSGATCSSVALREAYKNALGQITGETPQQAQIITTGKDDYSVKIGDKPFSLNAKAKTALSYKTDSPSVVTVDAKGTVTIVGKGTAKITITAKETSEYKSAAKTVSVTVSAADSVTKTGIATCKPDAKKQFEEYDVSLSVTFDNGKPVAIGEPAGADETNQTYLNNAFRGMKDELLKAQTESAVDTVDTVSGATCSSAALREAYKDALRQISDQSQQQSQTITVSKTSYSKTVGDGAFSLNAKAKTALSYKSDQTSVATVSSTGKVTIRGAGTAKITITAKATAEYKKAEKTVTVKVIKKKQTLTVSQTSYDVKIGDPNFSLGVTGNQTPLSYTSDNPACAAVDENGIVTIGTQEGTAKIVITAQETDLYQSASKTVTVYVGEQFKRNGTYTGTAMVDLYHYEVFLTVTFSDSAVRDIIMEMGSSGNEYDDEENEYYCEVAFERLKSKLMSAGSTEGIDAVSGSTYSSNAIFEAFEDACAQADAALGG